MVVGMTQCTEVEEGVYQANLNNTLIDTVSPQVVSLLKFSATSHNQTLTARIHLVRPCSVQTVEKFPNLNIICFNQIIKIRLFCLKNKFGSQINFSF